ncbi:MAG: hypothetical protein HY275_01310, partial [Gemmatimonadetes bacterium]|nr:hypothetical protein [Gemmatimonadota bacterium]
MWTWSIALIAAIAATLAGYWPLSTRTDWAARASLACRFVAALLAVA